MAPNPHALAASRKYHVPYHAVRMAVNRIVAAGWPRERAERYVDEVLEVGNDLDRAVEAVQREAGISV